MTKCKTCGNEIATKTSNSFRTNDCFDCQREKLHDKYLSYPMEEYEGQPFFADDKLYTEIEDFYEDCFFLEKTIEDMEPIKAEKVQFPELDIKDFLCDYIDSESDVPSTLEDAAEIFNKAVKKCNESERGYYHGVKVRINIPEEEEKR